VIVTELASHFADLPHGAWSEPAHTALAMPIMVPGAERPSALFIGAVSPRRVLDEDYQAFFNLLAGQIATTTAEAAAYQEQRKRAEALAELDRA